jgi:hypothetical protein
MNKPSEYDTGERNASHNQFPTQGQRKDLVRGALRFAHLFPSGDERSRFLEIARSLTFFAESVLHPDENPTDKSRCGRPYSIVRGPDNVIEIHMPSVLFEAIKQWAKAENRLLSDAIRIWVRGAVKGERIGRH